MTQAVGFDPHNALANQELGLALERLGRYGEAVLALQRAAALAPKRSSPHFFLGRIFRHLGRTADATAEYAIVSKLLASHSDTATPNPDRRP
jgi:Flp pilus assembly protein TadD